MLGDYNKDVFILQVSLGGSINLLNIKYFYLILAKKYYFYYNS
jgi:hypothetical protein